MEDAIFVAEIVFFVIAVLIIIYLSFRFAIKDKNVRNNVRNYDPIAGRYCYVLKCSQQEAIHRLSIRNINDKPEYKFNSGTLIITCFFMGATSDYQLFFYTIGNRTFLRVSSTKSMFSGRVYPFMINSFFIDKIGAVPVDYTYFESVVHPAG